MNKSNLKSYAPQARKDFIAAVTARANLLGLSDRGGMLEVAPAQMQGDITVIAGQAWPAKVSGQRDRLVERIRRDGFAQTMEAIAYTWFNRFAALRYMELHDYLGHGHRALSSASGGLPDILTYATDLASELPGLNAAKVTELKLAGNRDGELYCMLLVAQCNALSIAMPFLFERIDDDSELLLPDNLLRSDSVIAKLVAEIPEEDWAEVEIIGWLYQFYISEKKDQVIGKVVKSEDIPAATQLFTPNWIVQYLVQNSVGRLWLMANPQSTLASEWPYYITPAEQTPEVQAQLDALIQTRVREDGDTLNPESITVLDPACGSGHILVVAFDVLKAIYLERGYQPRAIPRLILEKNLYGLDIDDRAAQMAGFALLMKARADDRRLFTATDDAGNLQPPKLNVLSLQESKGLSVDELASHLAPFQVQRATIAALVETFEHAKTFGSLIQIPYAFKTHLAMLRQVLALVKQSGDMYATTAADDLLPLVHQATVLAMQFDTVVANPPYMGSKGMQQVLKDFALSRFPDTKADLFSMFMERAFHSKKSISFVSMVTMQSWMYFSSFEVWRKKLIDSYTLSSSVHIGFNSFPTMNSKIALASASTFIATKVTQYLGTYVDLNSAEPSADKNRLFLGRNKNTDYVVDQCTFNSVPGCPIAYWKDLTELFQGDLISSVMTSGGRCKTHADDMYVRFHWEVSYGDVGLDHKWCLYEKGGDFRRWYGNKLHVVNWSADARQSYASHGGLTQRKFWKRKGITWNAIALVYGFRLKDDDSEFSSVSPTLFMNDGSDPDLRLLAFLNSKVCAWLMNVLNPGLHALPGDVVKLPLKKIGNIQKVERSIKIAQADWNAYEQSHEFQGNELCKSENFQSSLESTFVKWLKKQENLAGELQEFEQENNKLFIDELGLASVLTTEVPLNQITLTSNLHYRIGKQESEKAELSNSSAFRGQSEYHLLCRKEACAELVSFMIGCMMGRYSLDEPGLIYAHAGNVGFDANRYTTFPADTDGIVPITDELWFADDAPSRVREFLRAVWGPDTLEENMTWLAESLSAKSGETSDETIRRYLADRFFKDHLQTYKKRPIYWLFSSGKQGAFQALVYLHRYNEGTLARLRAEYVVPLTSKIQSRIEMLQKDTAAATSTSARNKLAKEVEKLNKKHAELLAYDEKLRHYADMRISLDLDDGVKVNYGKFGDLLEGVKIVTGGSADD